MKIKITEKARKLYGKYCPFSTEKCGSIEELDYKIERCIDLGDIFEYERNTYLVRYYNLLFYIENQMIVDMKKNYDLYHPVKENTKEKHYMSHFKVVV